MDKAEKKRLKAQFKQQQQAQLRAAMPLAIEDFKDLLRYLHREDCPTCDHSLDQTRQFLRQRGLDQAEILPWLGRHGGGCDCEVAANVYNDYGDVLEWFLEDELDDEEEDEA